MKDFQATRGVQMDDNWESHRRDCERCRAFDASKPATAAAMCLEGAVLYKRDNQTRPKAVEAPRDEHYATKAQVKSAMRYKS